MAVAVQLPFQPRAVYRTRSIESCELVATEENSIVATIEVVAILNPSPNLYVAGSFNEHVAFGSTTLTSMLIPGGSDYNYDLFVAK